MAKNSYISNFNKVPAGLAVFLALAIAFECIIYFMPKYKFSKPPYEYAGMELKGTEADKGGNYAALIIGDCTGWAGIRTISLNRLLRISAFNFCGNAYQTYLVSYLTLKRYIKNSPVRPRLVILQISAMSLLWDHGMDFQTLRSFILPYFRVDDDLLSELDEDTRSKYFRYRMLTVLPSVRYQYLLREGVWWLSIFRQNEPEYRKYARLYRDELGFYDEGMDPTKLKVDEITDIGKNVKEFRVSEYNLRYLRKMLGFLMEQNIEVVVCLSPVRGDELSVWSRYGVREKLKAFLAGELKRYSNVTALIDLTDAVPDKKYYIDATHLRKDGAELYTKILADRIKIYLDAQI